MLLLISILQNMDVFSFHTVMNVCGAPFHSFSIHACSIVIVNVPCTHMHRMYQ